MESAPSGDAPTPPRLDAVGRSSPPPSCSICLGPFVNESYTENCLHQFCFGCLLKWSKIKTDCPLCKQPFKSIIHNVRSNDSYDKYDVEPHRNVDVVSEFEFANPIFRYRTTFTLPRESLQSLFINYSPNQRRTLTDSWEDASIFSRNRSPRIFRRTVYNQNLWAGPLADITGRYRECSPEFYRDNPAQITRLASWLTRELSVLVRAPSNVFDVLNVIIEKIKEMPINSRTFRGFIINFIPEHADHFIHEFYSFARSPYDMIGYDREVDYQTGSPFITDNYVNEISSDHEDSSDSDIRILSPQIEPLSAITRRNILTDSNSALNNDNVNGIRDPVMIETISQSETDDSSDEVVVVRYIKPPEDRTPEIVDLAASDSDAIIIEDQKPIMNISNIGDQKFISSMSNSNDINLPSTSGQAKFTYKRSFNSAISVTDSESDSSTKNLLKNQYKHSKPKNMKLVKKCCNTNENFDTDSSFTSSSSHVSSCNFSSMKDAAIRKVFSLHGEPSQSDNRMNGNSSTGSSTSVDEGSISPKRKRKSIKKSKKRKHSKKNVSLKKKHKHKSKSKKKQKSKEKRIITHHSQHEEKFKSLCSIFHKSKPKTTNMNTHSVGYWPRNLNYWPEKSMPQENKEKRIIKSVVISPQSCFSNLEPVVESQAVSSKFTSCKTEKNDNELQNNTNERSIYASDDDSL